MLPTAAAHHQTVPVANRTVASARTVEPDPEAAEHPPRDPDADRRQGDRDRLLVHGQPEQRDERQEHERRQGRERQQHLARRLPAGVEQRVDVAGSTSSADGRRRRGPASRTKPCRAGRRPPARRNGCTGCSARGWTTCTGPAPPNASSSPTTTAARRPAPGWAARGPVRALGYTPRPPSTLRRRLPVTGLGSGAPGRETTTDEAPRRGIGWRILAIARDRARVPPDHGIWVRRAPGIRVRRRTSACSGSGRTTSPTSGPFGFYDRGFFADYTPGYLYRAVAGRRRRPAPRRRRRPDQAAGDPHRRRARPTSST